MNNLKLEKRFRILVFFLLYFFWDRFFEAFIPFLPFGLFRPVVIIFLWMYIFFNWQYFRSSVHNFNSLKKWFYIILIMAFFLLMRSLYVGIPFLGIIYTYFQHLGFLPIVLLILSFSNYPVYIRKILYAVLISSLLLSVGVILDAYVGMNNIFAIEGVENMTRLNVQGIKRGDFTIGSTNVFVTLSIGVIAAYLLLLRFRYGLLKVLFYLAIMGLALYASGSRASFILGMMLILIILFRFMKIKRYILMLVFMITMTIGGFLSFLQIGILNLDNEKIARFENLSAEETEGNLGRFQSWADGLYLMLDGKNIYGHGVGTTNPKVGELFGSNHSLNDGFESSIFSRYYEGGIIGLILFLLPLMFCLLVNKKQLINVLGLWMILLFINFFIAPTAQGYPSNLIIYFALSLSILFSRNQNSPRRKNLVHQIN